MPTFRRDAEMRDGCVQSYRLARKIDGLGKAQAGLGDHTDHPSRFGVEVIKHSICQDSLLDEGKGNVGGHGEAKALPAGVKKVYDEIGETRATNPMPGAEAIAGNDKRRFAQPLINIETVTKIVDGEDHALTAVYFTGGKELGVKERVAAIAEKAR